MEYLNQGGNICLPGIVKYLLNNRTLPFGPLKVCVHLPQAHIGNSLNAVQVLHAGSFQMGGGDSRDVHCLRDKSIDIIELRFGQFYVHAAQKVDGIRCAVPVKGHEILHLHIQVCVNGRNIAGWSLQKVGLVQFSISAVCGVIHQKCVAV